MDGGAWWAAVHGVAKSWTRLRDFTFTFHFLALEKEMATHSSALAWRIPGTGEPGGLPSMGSHRVGHDWSNLAAAAAENSKDLQIICLYVPWLLFGKKQWASMSVEATRQPFVASSYLHLWFESPAMKTIRLFTFLFFLFFFCLFV